MARAVTRGRLGRAPRGNLLGAQGNGLQRKAIPVSTNDDLGELQGEDLADGDLDELESLEGYDDRGQPVEDDEEEEDATEQAVAEAGEVDEEPVADLDEDDDEEVEESLEALLGTDEATSTEVSPRVAGAKAPEGIGADEFTCRSCFLVKSRSQLADPDELLCADCA